MKPPARETVGPCGDRGSVVRLSIGSSSLQQRSDRLDYTGCITDSRELMGLGQGRKPAQWYQDPSSEPESLTRRLGCLLS